MRIKVLSNYVKPDKAIEIIESIWGRHKNVEFVTDESYTHVVVWNTYEGKDLNINPKNVVGFAHEPIDFLGLNKEREAWIKKNVGTYFIGGKGNLGEPFREGYCFQFHTPFSYDSIGTRKSKKISFFVSEKKMLWGHKYRHYLLKEILNLDLPIDIYGRGLSKLYNDKRICSDLEDYLKGMEPYEYSISIENSRHPYYVTEKLTNCLVCRTIPLYLGANSFVEKNFPSTISLVGEVKKDIEIISRVMKEDYNKYKSRVEDSRRNLVKNFNLLGFLEDWFK